MRSHLAASTLARDRSYLDSLILPTFGDRPVGDITTLDIEYWIQRQTVKPATVVKAFQILGGVFRRAVKTRRINANPCDLAEGLPRIIPEEMRFLTVGEVKRLAGECGRHDRLVLTAAYTGLRWGELAGLTYNNVNDNTISVIRVIVEAGGHITTKGPKTAASRRTVAIPKSIVKLIGTGDGYVFRASSGGPLRRSNFRPRVWVPATKAAGLSGVRFHDLRHTHASWLIAQGVHPKIVSSRLGHSTIGVTMDRYGHLMEGLDAEVADMLDTLV